jgi:hypothetical protein
LIGDVLVPTAGIDILTALASYGSMKRVIDFSYSLSLRGLLIWVISFVPLVQSFSFSFSPILPSSLGSLPRTPPKQSRFQLEVLLAQSDGYGDSAEQNIGPWVLRNDFQTFLNQCSIQSLVYLMNSLKDRESALWLEEFTEPIFRERRLEGARDSLYSSMAKAAKSATNAPGEESSGNREIKLLSYHGLAAMNTTKFPTWDSFYEQLLQEEDVFYCIQSSSPYVPDYDLDINPASICSRIISVREQISREFVKDLDVIADMSGQMLESYWEKVKMQKNSDEQVQVDRTNLLFLEFSPDRDSDYMPSPLRKGNFDLLTLLTTQESIHRVLNNPELRADNSFLRNFYAKRIGTHFTGSGWYSRADDFLEELLRTPPSMIQVRDSETALVDPMRVVELLLEEREKVATDWIELAMAAPESHVEIKRWQLNRLMGIRTTVENDFE